MKSNLKEMLSALINNNEEAADKLFHDYITQKTQHVLGLGEQMSEDEIDAILESATEEELDEAVRGHFSYPVFKSSSGKYEPEHSRPENAEEREMLAKYIKLNRRYRRNLNLNTKGFRSASDPKYPNYGAVAKNV